MKKIVAEIYPYDYAHDMYQEYYRRALKASMSSCDCDFVQKSNVYSIALLRILRRVRHSYRLRDIFNGNLLPNLFDALARLLSHGPNTESSLSVGLYTFTNEQKKEIRVCIDTNDFPDISEKHAASCHIYFKSNYWPSYCYPPNVLPLPNMNPLVGRNLKLFRRLRAMPKKYDLFAFFRVWGGNDELEGIEHNMALLKALSKVKCNSYILAFLVAGDIPSLGKRLDDIGVSWTTKAMPPLELWKKAAAARLNIVRMGMHQCVPWRMIDILAMGGVPIMDYKPMTLWHEPLVEGKHYLNLNFSLKREQESGNIRDKIESWLQNDSLISSISMNTAGYFDLYLEPEMLGRSIIQTVESWRQ